jgi:hypothetical protein
MRSAKKRIDCPLEADVLKALTTGNLEPGLKKHMEDCPVCSETAAVHAWMGRFRTVSMGTAERKMNIPDAETIWEKAFSKPVYVPDRELEKKVLRPLLFPQVLAYALGAAVVIFLFVSNPPGLRDLLDISPGTPVIVTSIAAMFKSLFKSFSGMLVPLGVGLVSAIFFSLITGFEGKREMAGK